MLIPVVYGLVQAFLDIRLKIPIPAIPAPKRTRDAGSGTEAVGW